MVTVMAITKTDALYNNSHLMSTLHIVIQKIETLSRNIKLSPIMEFSVLPLSLPYISKHTVLLSKTVHKLISQQTLFFLRYNSVFASI